MDKFHFTTIVSNDHLFKFIAMYASLDMHCNDYKLYALCANKEAYIILKTINFKNIIIYNLEELEDEKMLKAKGNRVFHAYCWTLKPFFLYYVMQNHNDSLYFAHLDADLCFYNDPMLIFDESPNASIYLTHHRNSEMFLKFYKITGIYNTGFVGCRNDKTAHFAISQWRDKCIENCPIKEDLENKIFGDQRYVENWPSEFKKVHVVNSLGANAALWNISDYTVTANENNIFVNNQLLIFYHFSGLTIISQNEFNLCWYYRIENKDAIFHIYILYLTILSNAIKDIKKYFPWFDSGFLARIHTPDTHYFKLD